MPWHLSVVEINKKRAVTPDDRIHGDGDGPPLSAAVLDPARAASNPLCNTGINPARGTPLRGEVNRHSSIMPFNTCVLYPNEDDLKFNMSYYLKSHLPLVKENFGSYGLKRVDVTEFGPSPDGTKPAFAIQAVIVWGSQDDMKKAMASTEAGLVFGDIKHFCNAKPVAMSGDSVA